MDTNKFYVYFDFLFKLPGVNVAQNVLQLLRHKDFKKSKSMIKQ